MGLWGDIKGGASGAYGWTKDKVNGGLDSLDRTSGVRDINEGNFQLQGQDQRRKSLLQQADFAAGRGGPQIAGSQFQGDQRGLVDMLNRRARGEGDSAAQMQLRDSLGQNLSSQQALLATGGAGGARAASQAAGQLSGSLAGQGAQLRAQEMQQAQGMLGQALGQFRGQDQNFQQMRSQNFLQNRQLNDSQYARLRGMELDNARLGLQGSMGLEQALNARRGQDLNTPTKGERVLSMAKDGASAYMTGGASLAG